MKRDVTFIKRSFLRFLREEKIFIDQTVGTYGDFGAVIDKKPKECDFSPIDRPESNLLRAEKSSTEPDTLSAISFTTTLLYLIK